MAPRVFKRLLFLLAIAGATVSTFFCNTPQDKDAAAAHASSPWLNVYDTSVHYVGMNTCRGCHAAIYDTYIQTGMGQSFGHATREKSAADFSPGHAVIYDKDLDFYYRPYWKSDSLYVLEYRLEGRDTVHRHEQHIDYVIGSGQHTNSHLFSTNGYTYQAPVTYYTQKKQWDLAPGYEKGASVRFSRIIEAECMTCHNGYPDFDASGLNRYTNIKTGIDCERCHGPGSLHVADKQSGKLVDTSKGPDYTIVNPRRLSTELQNNLCQRCHLQGLAVLNDGKSFFDFRPGMQLKEVMNVFMPEYEGAQDKIIMASHVERMKKSDCYVNSGKMSCITCHNPHVSVRFTPRSQYLNACGSCHGAVKGQALCSEQESVRMAKGNDCVTCHMPRNGSIDIPHVAVTDHYIRRRPQVDAQQKAEITAFLGLKCYNNDQVDAITTARGYMEFFERYNPNPGLIDSALRYLALMPEAESRDKQNRDYIRAYFLLGNFAKVTEYAAALRPEQIGDAWAAYRAGESYLITERPQQALPWLKRATEIRPRALDFQNKYGTCLLALNQVREARQVFESILSENPQHIDANDNLGYVYLQEGNSTMAYHYFSKALELGPDREQTLINLAVWYHSNGQDDKARKTLLHLLRRHPQNERAKAMLQDL